MSLATAEIGSKINCGQTKFGVECKRWTIDAKADAVNCSQFDLIRNRQRQVVDGDRVDGWTINCKS